MRATLFQGHCKKSKCNTNFECILHTFEVVGVTSTQNSLSRQFTWQHKPQVCFTSV